MINIQAKVYGTIKNIDGTTTFNTIVRFKLLHIGAAHNTLYVQDSEVEAYCDSSGYFETNIWVNTESSTMAPYEVTIYKNGREVSKWEAFIPEGVAEVAIEDLLTLSDIYTGTPVRYLRLEELLTSIRGGR